MHDNSSARIQAKAISLFKLKVAFITKLTVFLYWQEKNKLKFPKIKGQFNPYPGGYSPIWAIRERAAG